MSDYSVEIVIDDFVFGELVNVDKVSSNFLKYWISNNKIKAIVLKKHWNNIFNQLKKELKDVSEEIIAPFFATIAGIVSPYREKYVNEAGIEVNGEEVDKIKDDIEAITQIVNRHYATVKFLIVKDINPYKKMKIRITESNILTIDNFFDLMRSTKNELALEFLKYYNC